MHDYQVIKTFDRAPILIYALQQVLYVANITFDAQRDGLTIHPETRSTYADCYIR
jgi:hypothetical protein